MEDLIKEMSESATALIEELGKADKNKAAAARARKLTLILGKQGKRFRKESIEFHQKA